MELFLFIISALGFVVGGVCFLFRYISKRAVEEGLKDRSGAVMPLLLPYRTKALLIELIAWGLSLICAVGGIAVLIVDMTIIGGLGLTYTSGDAEGRCNCVAECVYGAKTVDFSKTSYDERGLWANGFYLTHDPYNAAAFMNYSLYVQSEGAFKSPIIGTAKKIVPTTEIIWSEGTEYACSFGEYMEADDYPIIFMHYFLGDYDELDCYIVYDSYGDQHTSYINTDFYRFEHEQYLKKTHPENYSVVTREAEHAYLQSVLDANPCADYDTTADVGPEDWVEYPEISAAVAKYFCTVYEYAVRHKTEDGTQTDYTSMISELSAYAKWFYDGDAEEGILSELSQNAYYAYAGQVQDKSEGGYIFEPAYADDEVYKTYYEEWVLTYGESDESLADMIYYIMRDNKYLGVNTTCESCKAVMASCEGSAWWMDFTGLFHFVEHSRVGFEYDEGSASLPVQSTGGGNNIGEAKGEYSCNIPEIMGGKSYYAFAMSGSVGGVEQTSPDGNNLTPHTVVNGTEYIDGNCYLANVSGVVGTRNSYEDQGKNIGCPIWSMAGCVSNVLGTPITPLMLCEGTGMLLDNAKKENGTAVGLSFYCKSDSFVNRSTGFQNIDNTRNGSSALIDFCRGYDSSFTVASVNNWDDAFEMLCDSTKNTVVRFSKDENSWSAGDWTEEAYMGNKNYVYAWNGAGMATLEERSNATYIRGGHYFYVVDADPASKQVLLCYNLSSSGYRWIPYRLIQTHGNFSVLQTNRRSGGGGSGASSMVDIEGYANPTDTESGRTDLTALRGVQVGSRRFEGSWYTKIDGWQQGTTSRRVSGFELYDAPPYNFSDFSSVYFLDLKYVQEDMYNWFVGTASYWGCDISNASIKKYISTKDSATNKSATGSVASLKAGDGGSLELVAAPIYGLMSNGEPGTDSYWEKYKDVSGMYGSGGYFSDIMNSAYISSTAYQTPCIAVIRGSDGNVYYAKVRYTDASGHNYPFCSGQSFRNSPKNLCSDINEPNALLPWSWKIEDGGRPNLYQPLCANTTGSEAGYDPLSSKTGYANLDGLCLEYGLPVTHQSGDAVAYSTVYDYISWLAANAAEGEQGPTTLYVETFKIESKEATQSFLGSGEYELLGLLICR